MTCVRHSPLKHLKFVASWPQTPAGLRFPGPEADPAWLIGPVVRQNPHPAGSLAAEKPAAVDRLVAVAEHKPVDLFGQTAGPDDD